MIEPKDILDQLEPIAQEAQKIRRQIGNRAPEQRLTDDQIIMISIAASLKRIADALVVADQSLATLPPDKP